MKRAIPSLMVGGDPAWVTYDSSAQALFTAAQITNATIKSAVNTIILSAKANGWWNLCNAIYGFAGDNVSQTYASQYKYNWKDPRDLDAAFRLSFNGGWTHASTGSTPNGTTGFANTHLVPSSVLSLNDAHISFYSRTNSDGSYADIAVADDVFSRRLLFYLNDTSNLTVNINDDNTNTISNSDSRGYYLGSRIVSDTVECYRNGSSIGPLTRDSIGLPGYNVYIGAQNRYVGAETTNMYSNRECAFATIGANISNAIQSLMYTNIQTYQTALSRNV